MPEKYGISVTFSTRNSRQYSNKTEKTPKAQKNPSKFYEQYKLLGHRDQKYELKWFYLLMRSPSFSFRINFVILHFSPSHLSGSTFDEGFTFVQVGNVGATSQVQLDMIFRVSMMKGRRFLASTASRGG